MCKLLNFRYPKSDTTWSHWGKWEICAKYFPHVMSVAQTYENSAKMEKNKMAMSPELSRVIRNCAWYQYECGNHVACLELVEITKHGCEDKDGLEYAHLCSHGACALYELHEVDQGKKLIESSFAIRNALLEPDDGQLANTFSNRGLLEASECKYAEALASFDAALRIRQKLKNVYLAANHVLKESLCKKEGSKMDILRTVQLFWQGNIELERGDITKAKTIFGEGRQIVASLVPTYIVVSAFEYKLGLIDLRCGDIDNAVKHFDEAIGIAKYREIRGEQGRAYRMKAVALRKKPTSSHAELAEAKECEVACREIEDEYYKNRNLETGNVTEDQMFDRMICAQRR
ncbi:hypothetical protein AK830_g1644 [Neonectria ditissima]|uniref:MalT-like TPR region domain-containing protein n=1 Tax=Neonectria ditissima TaxID=78410 RepID=A0A0P7BU61_9HYPO|nr:hypothetical protein AK830_g1644 [Neonectria ditissima]